MKQTRASACFKLLLVEDDIVVCQAIAKMLAVEFPAAEIYTAENGQQGLELFRKHRPEIVITDINMPIMNGFEMAKQLKALLPDISFIVITGYSDKRYLNDFNSIGFYTYIIKPVDLDKLFNLVEQCYTEKIRASNLPPND